MTEDVADPRDTRAVWLTTSRGGLDIFKALDENGAIVALGAALTAVAGAAC